MIIHIEFSEFLTSSHVVWSAELGTRPHIGAAEAPEMIFRFIVIWSNLRISSPSSRGVSVKYMCFGQSRSSLLAEF